MVLYYTKGGAKFWRHLCQVLMVFLTSFVAVRITEVQVKYVHQLTSHLKHAALVALPYERQPFQKHSGNLPGLHRPESGIFSKSGYGQNSAGAGCYCRMLKMRTNNANSIFRTKIPGVSHRSLFCLHSTDV